MTPFPEFLKKHAPLDFTDARIVADSGPILSGVAEMKVLKERIEFVKPETELGKLLTARRNHIYHQTNNLLKFYDLRVTRSGSDVVKLMDNGKTYLWKSLWNFYPEPAKV